MDLPDNLEHISHKNINFELENLDEIDGWLKAILSDIYIHLMNDFKSLNSGIFQIAWQLNKIREVDNGREMDTKNGNEEGQVA